MSDPAIFLTGTGTGVGKTVAGCALAARWAAEGRGPRVLKPAETGCARKDGALFPADAWALKEMSGDPRPLPEICPYRYAAPMAPAQAAEREGAPPDLDAIERTVSTLRSSPGPLLVEGAGGLLVPLAPGTQMIDFAARCRLALLIIAPLGLGTLNATQLTLRAARAEGLPVAGIILSDLDGENSPAARRNPSAIEALCDAPLLGVLPHLPNLPELVNGNAEELEAARQQLLQAAGGIQLSLLDEG